jgi:hypothetical protein
MRRASALLAFAAGAILVVACDETRPTLSDPVTGNAYGFVLVPNATNLPNAGSARFVFKRTATETTPDSVVITIRGLDSLSSGFYTLWVGDSLGTSFKRAAGDVSFVRTDTVFNADGGVIATPTTVNLGTVSSFSNGSPRENFTIKITRATAGLAVSDSMQTVLITVEPTNAATTPTLTSAPLFARRGDFTNVVPAAPAVAFKTAAVRFGNFGPLAIDQYLFIPTIRGRGAFQGPILIVNDSSLSRPPRGYFYAFWAIKAAVGTTPGDTIYLGEQRSPYPRRDISQRDADVSNPDPLVILTTPPEILAGSIRVSADTLGLTGTTCADDTPGCPWKGVTEIWVTLEPKAGFSGRMGVMRIANAFAPGVITLGQRQ